MQSIEIPTGWLEMAAGVKTDPSNLGSATMGQLNHVASRSRDAWLRGVMRSQGNVPGGEAMGLPCP